MQNKTQPQKQVPLYALQASKRHISICCMSCMLLLACATVSCRLAVTGALTWSVPAFGLSHRHKHAFWGLFPLAACGLHCMVSTEHCIELRWLFSCREQCRRS